MKLLRTALLHLVCVGPNILTALILGFVRLAWGKKTRWFKGVAIVELDENKWLARGPYKEWGGTTYGPHGFMVNAGAMDSADHELVHTEQMQAEALQNAILVGAAAGFTGLSVLTIVAIVWWIASPLTALFSGNLTALLRGEPFYRGSHFEEGAYNREGHDHE